MLTAEASLRHQVELVVHRRLRKPRAQLGRKRMRLEPEFFWHHHISVLFYLVSYTLTGGWLWDISEQFSMADNPSIFLLQAGVILPWALLISLWLRVSVLPTGRQWHPITPLPHTSISALICHAGINTKLNARKLREGSALGKNSGAAHSFVIYHGLQKRCNENSETTRCSTTLYIPIPDAATAPLTSCLGLCSCTYWPIPVCEPAAGPQPAIGRYHFFLASMKPCTVGMVSEAVAVGLKGLSSGCHIPLQSDCFFEENVSKVRVSCLLWNLGCKILDKSDP